MSIMKKINERFERNMSLGESDIYRKFSEQFENLFNAEEVANDKEEFESIYVEDGNFETQIKEFRNSETSMAKFCVGYTGIGKTTSIRFCFGLGVSNEAYLNDAKGEVIFPTFLDGYQISDMNKFDLAPRIAAVCTSMEEKYPELRALLRTDEGKEELYEFIRRHTGFALEHIDPMLAMDMDDHQLIVAKLRSAYEKSPYEFQANKLKFYIKKKYDVYNRLIIILDDIESLPENYQRETIGNFLKFQDCMENTDYPKDHKYRVNLLISVRPHTYRIFNKNRNIETFPIGARPILKRTCVDLQNIFEQRFEYYTKRSTKVIGNMDTWKKCSDALLAMNSAFDGQYKEMIINLCFKNVREALASYSRIFANRYWVQKNKTREIIFTIAGPEYTFNNINVIRALACNEEPVFWGDDSHMVIPNIFLTTREEDLSTCCLLVLAYFYHKRGEVYGLNAALLGEIKEEWKGIFGADISKKLLQALEYLFIQRILRKSIEDVDDIRTLDTKESLQDRSKLYISPRGCEMYEMFMRDSVLLEMLRENAWRDYENREYSDASSSELMRIGKQDQIFYDLLEYTDYLCEKEDDMLSASKILATQEKYKAAFGKTAVVQKLLTGIKNSLDYSGIINDPAIYKKYKEVDVKICMLTNRLQEGA